MPAWVAPVVSGAAAVGGSLLSNMMGDAQARRQMDFQKFMSNTAHQREVSDLRRAGLNPILSATGGQGASTPVGAQAQMQDMLGPGVTSALEARRLQKDIKGVDAQAALAESQGMASQAAANRDNTSARETAVRTQLIQETAPAEIAEAKNREAQAAYDRKAMKYDNIQRRVKGGLDTVNSAKDILKPLNPFKEIRVPDWQGTGKDGTRYHRKTGEILRNK